ncbi:Gfo/Idh/MocA family protein [Roseobacter weihaiensis]|uniref:Gfo/Idh/MocA family protein n=1 Tax=Roseobacter weihaiensis TaxID=2763262 RepID=UPI001D09CAB3|nr:Gfo/Idh/MocA family oxidoreductase [Roseobacter sp. H9]
MKKAVLIGLGMVAETHLKAIRDAPSVSLRGVMGRTPSKVEAFSDRAAGIIGYPVHAYRDIAEVAADKAVDFAIVATPPDARLDLVRALLAGRKPILMEKPIERDLATAREIVALCRDAKLPLAVVLQHRARAASLALKKAVNTGALGKIVAAEIRVPWWRAQGYYDVPGRGTYARDGGGVMITQAIHTLDLALWMLGPVRRVQALMRTTPLHQLEAEDWAGALFETEGGCVGTLMATTAAFPGQPESISLHGTKARAHLETGKLTLQTHDGNTQTYGSGAQTGGGADPMAFTHGWHQSVLEDFAACLSSGEEPLATGQSALRAHAVIDAMETASKHEAWTEVSPL